MPNALRVLLLEDNPLDAELIVAQLREDGFEPAWTRVDTEAGFRAELTPEVDLILSDYQMPQFTALRALQVLRESGVDVPCIIISGTIGEDMAVAAMKEGASDYLLKDRLGRLGQAVQRVLEQRRLRRERITAEAAMRQRDEDFRVLFASNPMPMWVFDETTLRFLAVNQAAVMHYGYTEEEFLAMTIADIRPPEDVPALMQAGPPPENGIQHYGVWRHRTKDGRLIRVEITSHGIQFGGRTAELVLAHDVTQQLESEAALRESEERFRQVVENIHEVFWMTDVEHREMFYISPGYEPIWGRSAANLIQSPSVWLEAIHPDDRTRVAEAMRTKQVTGGYDETYRIVRPDGTVRWIRDQAFPVRRNDEPVTRVVGIAEDVTERKLLEAQFLRAQRLEAIGTLAGGVAHDLNNILAPMLMAASLLKDSASSARDREMLAMVERSAQRGADIIRQLLTYSRGVQGARVPVQPRHLLREVEGIIRETFPREISISFHLPKALWCVVADATQLHQVLMNLCVNARDAMPDGGNLRVSAENVEVKAEMAAKWSGARPGPFVAIWIDDTGTGIEPDHVARIFDPFFTTKEVGKGTGLGLSTALGIVTSHGGFLTLESHPGEGTKFGVYLPGVVEATEPTEPRGEPRANRGRGELILVVDDEESIREATRHVLVESGYRVVTAANGRHALTVFLAHRDEVKLVITDVMMPEMGGGTLARALRVLAPKLKILATSGLESNRQHREFAALGQTEIVQKPCETVQLLEAVHRTLNAPAA